MDNYNPFQHERMINDNVDTDDVDTDEGGSSLKHPLHAHWDCTNGASVDGMLAACLDAADKYALALSPLLPRPQEEPRMFAWDRVKTLLELGFPELAACVDLVHHPLCLLNNTDDRINHSWHHASSESGNSHSNSNSNNLATIRNMAVNASKSGIISPWVKDTLLEALTLWATSYAKAAAHNQQNFHPASNNNVGHLYGCTNEEEAQGGALPASVSQIEIFSPCHVLEMAAILLTLQAFLGPCTFSCSRLPLEQQQQQHSPIIAAVPYVGCGVSQIIPSSSIVTMDLLMGMTTYIVDGPMMQHHGSVLEASAATKELVSPATAALLRVLTASRTEGGQRMPSQQQHFRQQQPPPCFVPRAVGVGTKNDLPCVRLIAGENAPLPLLGAAAAQYHHQQQPSPARLNEKDVPLVAVVQKKDVTQEEEGKLVEKWKMDTLTHLEANLDDTTPEVLAYVVSVLLEKSCAIDAWVTPIVMKKGRAAHTLHCLCHSERENDNEHGHHDETTNTDARIRTRSQNHQYPQTQTDQLLELIFRETTTLGIRIHSGLERAALRREFISCQTPYVDEERQGIVDVKVGYLTDEVVSVKAEFEHCRTIARTTGVALKKVSQHAEHQVWNKLLTLPSKEEKELIDCGCRQDNITSIEVDYAGENKPATCSTTKSSNDSAILSSSQCEPLQHFNMYGWRPTASVTDDENYMDIVLLLTRSSKCRQGSMGCLIIRPSTYIRPSTGMAEGANEEVEELEHRLYRNILGAANNQPLFSDNDSDVHAEIGALGYMAQRGHSALWCTAYITMPPCKRCFAALYMAGIKRVVTPLNCKDSVLQNASEQHGMTMSCVKNEEQSLRITALTNKVTTGTEQKEKDITRQRQQRKEERTKRKAKAAMKHQAD